MEKIFGALAPEFSPNERVQRGHMQWWENFPASTNIEDRRTPVEKLFDQPPLYQVPNGMGGATELSPVGVENLQDKFRQTAMAEQAANAPMLQKALHAFILGMTGRAR